MANPIEFDISQLPSLRKDNMTIKDESNLRRRTCRYIEEAGRLLKLPRLAIATAMVFFHRFYAKHAFSDHDRFEVAIAAIVLAAKTEESPKKVDQVIAICHDLKNRGVQAGKVAKTSLPQAAKEADEENVKKLKERVLLLERVLLHTIGFELSIDHPYKFLVEQIKRLVQNKRIEFIPGSDKANEFAKAATSRIQADLNSQMVQWSMNFANDSMHTNLCLQFDPEDIATTAVYLAGQYAKIRPVGGVDWIEALGQPDVGTITSIAVQLIDVIVGHKSDEEKAVFSKIKNNLETLRNESKNTTTTSEEASDPSKRRRTDEVTSKG